MTPQKILLDADAKAWLVKTAFQAIKILCRDSSEADPNLQKARRTKVMLQDLYRCHARAKTPSKHKPPTRDQVDFQAKSRIKIT